MTGRGQFAPDALQARLAAARGCEAVALAEHMFQVLEELLAVAFGLAAGGPGIAPAYAVAQFQIEDRSTARAAELDDADVRHPGQLAALQCGIGQAHLF